MPGHRIHPAAERDQNGGVLGHVLGLKQRLVKGKAFPLTLTFEKAGPVTVEVDVQSAGATAPTHEGMADQQTGEHTAGMPHKTN